MLKIDLPDIWFSKWPNRTWSAAWNFDEKNSENAKRGVKEKMALQRSKRIHYLLGKKILLELLKCITKEITIFWLSDVFAVISNHRISLHLQQVAYSLKSYEEKMTTSQIKLHRILSKLLSPSHLLLNAVSFWFNRRKYVFGKLG